MTNRRLMVLANLLHRSGKSPFVPWLDGLDDPAAARVLTTLTRIEQGNVASVNGVGGGVFESRIDVGSGLRVYFGKDGPAMTKPTTRS